MRKIFLLAIGAAFAGCKPSVETPSANIELGTVDEQTAATSAHAAELGWPQMFGPNGNSRVPADGIELDWNNEKPPELWRASIGHGYSGMVAAQGKVVAVHRFDDWEVCTCFAADSGEIVWETAWPTAYHCPYKYSNGPYCTPTLAGGSLYVMGAEAQLICLDSETGHRKWKRNLKRDYEIADTAFGFGATPLFDAERLYINIGGTKPNSGIIAVDARTGETIWTATDEIASYCTPVVASIHNKKYLFVLAQENLVCLDPETGDEVWREAFGIKNTPERVNAVTPLLVGENHVLVTSGPGPGAVLFEVLPDGQHKTLWRTRRKGLESQYTNIWQQDKLIFGFSPRTACDLICIDVSTGETKWRWNHDHELRRSMTIAVGDGAICLDADGRLYSLKLTSEAPELVSWSNDPVLEAPCFTQPCLAEGKLYVRNEQDLICLDVSATKQERIADSSEPRTK